jgi:hypothetical protein
MLDSLRAPIGSPTEVAGGDLKVLFRSRNRVSPLVLSQDPETFSPWPSIGSRKVKQSSRHVELGAIRTDPDKRLSPFAGYLFNRSQNGERSTLLVKGPEILVGRDDERSSQEKEGLGDRLFWVIESTFGVEVGIGPSPSRLDTSGDDCGGIIGKYDHLESLKRVAIPANAVSLVLLEIATRTLDYQDSEPCSGLAGG